MAISFISIPTNIRTPNVFVEFDNSRAQQGPSVMPHRLLMIGQKLAAGSEPALTLKQVTRVDQAKALYGRGSILAQMLEKSLQNNLITETFAIALDDDGAAVAAVGSFTLTGSPTEAGTLSLAIAGQRARVAVSSGQALSAIASAAVSAINAIADMPVSAAVGGSPEEIELTAKNAGLLGNDIDLRVNLFSDEELPAGLGVTVSAMSGGSANPDISSVIPLMGETQYTEIALPYTDAANLTVMETELESRFGPLRQNDGVAFSAARGTLGSLSTLGNSKNTQVLSIMSVQGPSSPWEWVGAVSGAAALSLQQDPARPMQTIPLQGIIAEDADKRFIQSERNTLLFDGISTHIVDSGGNVLIERMITTFKENAFGSPDTSFLDVNTLATLSFLRFDFRARFSNKFPRHKLANDDVRPAPGQAIITPSIGKAEAIAIFRGWEDLGLVEGGDQFKRDLIVERNAQDPNRLDFLLPPDLINQLRVTGVQIQFLL